MNGTHLPNILIQYAFTVNGNVSGYYLVLFVVNSNEINICHLQN